MYDHRTPKGGAHRHHTHKATAIAANVALVAALSTAVPTASAATTPTTMVPACSGINVRTGASTGSAVRATLGANATLTITGKVSGGSWRTTCPTPKTGTTWYRVSEINGKAVEESFGVAQLYAAAGVLTDAPSADPSAPDAFGAALMRLINLDREALGKAPYMIDGRLADIARDARFTCPTDPRKAFNGRARDMADRGYFAHNVPRLLLVRERRRSVPSRSSAGSSATPAPGARSSTGTSPARPRRPTNSAATSTGSRAPAARRPPRTG